MPQLNYTFTVPAGVRVTLLVIETGSKQQGELTGTGADPDVITGSIKFKAATNQLVIMAEAIGTPNLAVQFNFTTPAGTKVYPEDQEIILKAKGPGAGTGVFLDKAAILPKP